MQIHTPSIYKTKFIITMANIMQKLYKNYAKFLEKLKHFMQINFLILPMNILNVKSKADCAKLLPPCVCQHANQPINTLYSQFTCIYFITWLLI